MKAREYFRPADEEKGEFTQNRLGGTLGGPILKSKLFFFSSFGGIYQRESGSDILSLPPASARAGDFSNVTAVIYDPATGNPDGTGRLPFPNNRIPETRIDPISRKHPLVEPLAPITHAVPDRHVRPTAEAVQRYGLLRKHFTHSPSLDEYLLIAA
ncbi:MAG: hypothetical protein ACREUC_15455, partial [Steroidobacteraceae bacterium]